MKKALKLFGIDIKHFSRCVRSLPWFFSSLKQYRKQERTAANIAAGGNFPVKASYPCLADRFESGGVASGHYFHQDLLVARRIHINAPQTHYDVGSRIDGFVAHVASFRQIYVLDIRQIENKIENIVFTRQDMMGELDDSLKECTDSISCLHALEHFGLGRYGDPICRDSHLKGWQNLYDMLKVNGRLYFSVPIGEQRIEFNAHRVFSVKYLLQLFDGKYKIEHFSYVDDNGDLHKNVEITEEDIVNNYGCKCGCGIFELTKLR